MMDTTRALLLLGVVLGIAVPGADASAAAADGAAAAHDALSCSACHGRAFQAGAETQTAAARQERCLSCHASAANAGASSMFHGRGRCLQCHTFHDAGTVVTAAGTVDLAALAGVNRAHCRSCHDGKGQLSDLSDSHREAGRLYHEQAAQLADLPGSTPCLWCHSDSRGSDWQAAASGDRIAFAEHASHPFGIPVRPGQGAVVRRMREVIDPRIPLPEGRLECVSCHQLTASTKDRLIPFPTPKQLCLGCHQLNDQGGGGGVRLANLGNP